MPSIRKNVVFYLARGLARSLSLLEDRDITSLGGTFGRSLSTEEKVKFPRFTAAAENIYKNVSNELDKNGERWLIEKTGSLNFKTVFDVGANIGKWSNIVLSSHPNANVHCFEIVDSTFAQLKDNIGHSDKVTLNNFGLSDTDTDIEVFVSPENHHVSSTLNFGYGGNMESKMAQVKIGENYAKDNKIDHIDLLKIDVEGAEKSVMDGFSTYIRENKIRLIQFEYNEGAIISHNLLYDFYKMLEGAGYTLGRLGADGVVFQQYSFHLEDFNGPNYVACLKDDRELIELLSA